MRFQTILGVGVVAILAYLVYEFFSSKTVGAFGTAAANTIENAATGQLTQNQINGLVSSEANGLVTASGGTMTLAQATAIAQNDVNNNSASPSYWDGVKAAFSELF